jgi:uridine monophosphate synthetase
MASGTVQRQYTAGPLSIAKWAEIVNAHIFPGPAIVTALKQAAHDAIAVYNSSVSTEISVGSPAQDSAHSDEDAIPLPPEVIASSSAQGGQRSSGQDDAMLNEPARDTRKASIVSITTTISAKTEPISPQPTPALDALGEESLADASPYLRALLLLAEMSSEGNLLTSDYTQQCVAVARQNKDFVIGFIAQHALNSEDADNFLTMTPGVSLPPAGKEEGATMGDELGQRYNTPRQVVLEQGGDVIIVGRGIIRADDPAAEAERYRMEGWRAYEERIGTGR